MNFIVYIHHIYRLACMHDIPVYFIYIIYVMLYNVCAGQRARQVELRNSLYAKPVSQIERRRIFKEAAEATLEEHADAGEINGSVSSGNSASDQSRSDDDGEPDNDLADEKCHQQIVRVHKKTLV